MTAAQPLPPLAPRTILAGSLALIACLAAGAAAATESGTRLPADTHPEMRTGYDDKNLFDNWDTDTNDVIEGRELAYGLHAAWDANNDGFVSQSEWEDGSRRWFGEQPTIPYQDWDDNGDGQLSRDEYMQHYSEVDWHQQLDADGDGVLDAKEVASALPEELESVE